ncbi:LacI family transcriptional regulator [Pendulispora rubella]|uniref:LacI family transcriptional regulator n=1 Tax=Pendulispora rubella TaxID=2741070 RepID=A0ABZ2LGC2_9BACT
MAEKQKTHRQPKLSRPTTIRDIAEHTGVAVMTVSRVVNESGYVSQEMREKVLKAVQELNYHPNGLARGLKRRRTQAIGILVPDIANPFAAELVGGIQEVLSARGYSSFISTSDRSTTREEAGLRALFDHRADGAIVATRETKAGNDFLLGLLNYDLQIVVVGRELNHPRVDRVTADHFKGGYDVTEHLIRMGHTRIAFVGVTPANGAGLHRYRGYMEALRANGIPFDEQLVVGPKVDAGPGFSTQDDGYEGTKRLLASKRHPTAIFARNDFTAMGSMYAIRDAGLAIPDDIAVAGFDNVPLSAYTAPPLTTVAQRTVLQGREAALLLLDRIDGNRQRERRNICLDCELIVRQSTTRS